MVFAVVIVGMERVTSKFAKISIGMTNFKIPLKEAEKYMNKSMFEKFQSGGKPKKWKKVKKRTLELREVNKAQQPLIDRGNLLRAVSSPRSRYARHKIFKTQLRFGISDTLPYARIQNYGGTVKNGWGKGIPIEIPARPFMEITKKDDKEIEKIFDKYLELLANA